jgi:hypothetical protein
MCAMCDGATYGEVLEDLDHCVRHHGWAVQGVQARRPWLYTIGLAERFDHAELVMAGVDLSVAVHALNALGTMVATGEVLHPGRTGVRVGETEVAFGEVHPVHIANGLVAMWHALYLDHRQVEPPRLDVVQVLPLPGRRVPLDVPHTSLE